MSDTPRYDKAIAECKHDNDEPIYILCCQLERELAAAQAEREKWRTAASVICGAHIGQTWEAPSCPICEWKKAQAENARLGEIVKNSHYGLPPEDYAKLQAENAKLREEIDMLHMDVSARTAERDWAREECAKLRQERDELDEKLTATRECYRQLSNDYITVEQERDTLLSGNSRLAEERDAAKIERAAILRCYEELTAKVNALLAAIERIREYSPVYVVVQADKQASNVIRAQDYDETHAIIRRYADTVREAMGK